MRVFPSPVKLDFHLVPEMSMVDKQLYPLTDSSFVLFAARDLINR